MAWRHVTTGSRYSEYKCDVCGIVEFVSEDSDFDLRNRECNCPEGPNAGNEGEVPGTV